MRQVISDHGKEVIFLLTSKTAFLYFSSSSKYFGFVILEISAADAS